MWILPKQLHTSAFVPDTEALISDLAEQSQACAQSLLVRSKVSPARTWSLKWKRDSWTQLLSGRILKPSHGQSFTAAWTSSVAATRASHSAQPENASAPKTQDTSGHLSQPELLSCDQVPVSLKTSRDISRWGCPTLSKTWQEWVTERRGAWRQRVNAARLTSAKGSSSWPTIRASEYKDVGPVGSKSHDHMLGKHYLCAVVTQEEANWPTPCAMEAEKAGLFNKGQMGQSLSAMANRGELHGQAAPASSSSLGSRQELWATPRAGLPSSRDQTNPKNGAVLQQQARQWATPRSGKTTDENPETWALRQAKGDVATMPLGAQVKAWATPQAHDAQGPKTPEQIAAMRAKGHGVKNLNEMVSWATPNARDPKGAQGRMAKLGQISDLPSQTEVAPTGQWNRANGKLNPAWVTCLMGLDLGWVAPMCPVSVIKNWPRFVSGWLRPQTAPIPCDSLAMELCQPPQSEPSEFFLAS
jgi:hypothetical protein